MSLIRLTGLALLAACTRADHETVDSGTTWVDPPFPPAEDHDQDGFGVDLDCDDQDPTVFPGAVEVCGDDRRTDCAGPGDQGVVTVVGGGSFHDLGEALASAAEAAEILVCGWVEGGVVAPVPVRLVGYTDFAAIYGDRGETLLVVPPGTEITRLTLQYGGGDEGGGVRLSAAGTLTLRDTTVISNVARVGGGIALPEGGTVQILEGSSVQGNVASEGGGGVHAPAGSVVELDDTSVVEYNWAVFGGGVWLEDATLRGGAVVDNSASSGIELALADGVVQNTDPLGGGGVLATGRSTVEHTSVTGNVGYVGGGITAWGGELTLTDVRLELNHADAYGGGLLVAGGAATLDDATEIAIGIGQDGGGAAVFAGTLTGGIITTGSAFGTGAGLYLHHGTATAVTVRGSEGNGAAVAAAIAGALVDVVVEDNGSTGIEATDWSGVDPTATPGVLSLVRTVVARNGHAPHRDSYGGGLVALLPVEATDSVLEGNFIAWGSSAILAQDPVSWSGGRIVANHSDDGGPASAAIIVAGGSFTAAAVDFGTGAEANTPTDVLTYADTSPYAATLWDLEGEVTVSCTAAGCG